MILSKGGPRFRAAIKLIGAAAVLSLLFLLIHSLPHKKRGANTSIPLRILPLGDSITWGWQPAHQENGTNGYRAQLLSDLIGSWYKSVDFVGTQHSGYMFDNDNEGHSGFTISQIQGAMKAGLKLRPNVVLLHAGTNDLNRPETTAESWADAPKRLGIVLDEVQKSCPDAVVILAKIIQAEKVQTRLNLKAFNEALPSLVADRVKKGAKVTLVDQSVIGHSELVDGLHPTYVGYAHMGNIWFKGIHTANTKGLITPPVSMKQSKTI